jgi:hypothetical protein
MITHSSIYITLEFKHSQRDNTMKHRHIQHIVIAVKMPEHRAAPDLSASMRLSSCAQAALGIQ